MADIVHDAMPSVILGSWSSRKMLEHIFEFRRQKLIELFG
jgi:hypothetical protein